MKFFTNQLFGSKPMKNHGSLSYSTPKKILCDGHCRNSTLITRPSSLFAECLLQWLCFDSDIFNHSSIMYLGMRKLCSLGYVFSAYQEIPPNSAANILSSSMKPCFLPSCCPFLHRLLFCSCLTKIYSPGKHI